MAIETTINHTSDGYNGLLDWLGRNKGAGSWQHPETSRGFVSTSQSSTLAGLGSDNGIDHANDTTSGRTHTQNVAFSWWMIDFGASNSVKVTRLGILGQNYHANQPKYYKYQGSINGVDWTDLNASGGSQIPPNGWESYTITDATRWRYIRVIFYNSPGDSSGQNYLILGDFEVWGEYHDIGADEDGTPTGGDTWDDVHFRIDIAGGLLATDEIPGGEWDVDIWDDDTNSLWGGSEYDWQDITDDYIDLRIKRGGRSEWGTHYRAGTATIKLKNLEGIYSPTQPVEAAINLTAGALIRIVAVSGENEYTVFTGKVRRVVDPDPPGQVPITTVHLVDALADLAKQNRIATTASGAGEYPGPRINRLLDDIAVPSDYRVISGGEETLQATTKSGNLLAELQLIADSEGGELFVDAHGRIVFLDRDEVDAQADATPTLTVAGYADPGGAGNWICWARYTPEYSLDRVRNHATIARVGGTAQLATDSTSINDYGRSPVVRTDLLNQSDTWPATLATRIVANRKDVKERIKSVLLTSGEAAETAAALNLELGDPIRTRRIVGVDPNDYEVDELALIQSIEIDARPAGEDANGVRRDEWTMKLTTDSNYTTT